VTGERTRDTGGESPTSRGVTDVAVIGGEGGAMNHGERFSTPITLREVA